MMVGMPLTRFGQFPFPLREQFGKEIPFGEQKFNYVIKIIFMNLFVTCLYFEYLRSTERIDGGFVCECNDIVLLALVALLR